MSTSRGLSKVVAIAVDSRVFAIIHVTEGPTKYRITSKLWKVIAVSSVLHTKYMREDL